MSEVEVTGDIIELIDEARMETLHHSREQVRTAMDLFSSGDYESACFISMTAIEEAGKVGLLQFIRGNQLWGTPSRIDTDELRSILSDHQGKALRSAASALCVNNRAKRIYGTYPDSDLDLKNGLLLLARAGNEWMRIRGNCIYTDLDLHSKSLKVPSREINSDYAYYFICMGGEVVAEEAERGLGSFVENRDPEESIRFWDQTKAEIDNFVEEYESQFEPTNLEFFTDPRFETIREKISKPLDISEEQIEQSIRQSVDQFRMAAQMRGEPEDEIEKQASELKESLEESFPESLPSAECSREFERLAENVNNVVVGEWNRIE